MRLAMQSNDYVVMFITQDFYTDPHNLLSMQLCKEMVKPVILVCWKDSPLRNDLLNGLTGVACIQLGPLEKSTDAHVSALIQSTWETYKGRKHAVWGQKA